MEVKLNNVSVEYNSRKILNNITFEVQKGEFISILGRNGSGKSTIIKAISNNVALTSGNIIMFDQEVKKFKRKMLARKVAYLLQFNSITSSLSVYDYVAYGRIPFKRTLESINQEDDKIIMQALEQTDLLALKNRLLSQLSGGEKQRVYLAMCLAQQPEVIILDEPTNHLDIKFQYDLLKLIRQINLEKKVTVICVLHDLNQAIKFSDRLILLKNGKIYRDGHIKECIDEKAIFDVFGVNVKIHYESSGIHVDYLI